jgi:hypothetical protein
MQHTQSVTQKSSEGQPANKLYMESNLLRIAGALFCHDQKTAGKRTAPIELNSGVIERHIVVRPDQRLGQPGPLAHKIFVALIKKHSDYSRPIRSEIHFTRREIGRLIGRKEWGGRDSEQLSRALHEIHYAFVTTHFKQPGGRFITLRRALRLIECENLFDIVQFTGFAQELDRAVASRGLCIKRVLLRSDVLRDVVVRPRLPLCL